MNNNVISFGEMLWDVFPDSTVPGGATLNVALRLSSLGIDTRMISAVGTEPAGNELIEILEKAGVDTSMVQIHPSLDTGKVYVTLDENGNGSYTITRPSAWDEILLTDTLVTAASGADAIVYGSLGSRNEISRNTLKQLLEVSKLKVFDINLRPPHYSFEILTELIKSADLVKLNEEELREYCSYANEKSIDIKILTRFISELNPNAVFCITKAENGALIFDQNRFWDHPGYRVKVADTVGAGDGFLAGLVSRHLRGEAWPEALDYACALGALVASKPTANPSVTEAEIRELMQRN